MATRTSVEVRENGGDPDTIHQALDIVVPGFYEDPVFAWMFHELDAEQRREKIWKILRPCLKSAPVAGGFILDAKDWGAAMAVTCPGQKYDSLVSIWKSGGVSATFQSGLKPTYRLLVEYQEAIDKAKGKVLRKGHFYDCYYIMRVVELARKDGKQIWLEATTAYSRRQFTRFGFKLAGEMIVGKGRVDKDGIRKRGGEEVSIAGMVWKPDGEEKGEDEGQADPRDGK